MTGDLQRYTESIEDGLKTLRFMAYRSSLRLLFILAYRVLQRHFLKISLKNYECG